MPVEGPIATEGLQSAPGPIEDGISIGTHSGNHECQLHHKRQGNGSDLHGHHNHFSGTGGHQWPQAGGLNSEAHHRRHHGPHRVN